MKLKILIVVILVCIVSIGGLLIYGKTWEKEEGIVVPDKYTEADSVPLQASGQDNRSDIYDSEGDVCCYICGEVKEPGVKRLEAGSRIVDFVDAAGGFTENAAVNYLNLATKVVDGEKIYVPSLIEVQENNLNIEIDDSDPLININTSSVNELMKLPGIGESKATAIVNYREENGAFASIEAIKKVSGIGESTFSNIKAYIRI